MPALGHSYLSSIPSELVVKGAVQSVGVPTNALVVSLAERQRLCSSPHVRVSEPTTISFLPPRDSCSFGMDGNLSAKEGYFRARSEFLTEITPPAGTIACSVEFLFQSREFRYSDAIQFRVASQTVARSFTLAHVGDDWLSLQRESFASETKPYCGSGMSCAIPFDDQVGALTVSGQIDLSARAVDGIELGLTVYGDAGSEDCRHSGLNAAVRYQYVEVK